MQQKYLTQYVPVALLCLCSANAALAFNPFESLGKAMQTGANNTARAQPAGETRSENSPAAQQQDALGLGAASKRRVIYEGYTKEMLPIKKLIAEGKVAEAIKEKQKTYPKPDDYDVLADLEFGLMSLDDADVSNAQQRFTHAERQQVAEEEQSTVGGFFSGIGKSVVKVASGNEEFGDYEGVGFERVLMLNYKSIAYMLEGDRNAYNVTRRAIDLQNIEKKAFDEEVRKAKEEIKKEQEQQKKKGADLQKVGFDSLVEQQYKETDRKAKKVPSAFVNPFGFYIAGVVQELDSYEDKSLRDNARISYKKALELNPKSHVIKQAVSELKRPAPTGRRLVNVVVGDGFAPEKKLLKFDLTMGTGLPTEIELPIYEPVASQVYRVEAQTTSGKRWAKLSEVADITALALRFQKDAGPLQQLRMMTTVIRNVIEGQAWNQATQSAGLFGSLVSSVKKERDEMVHPDMRSWSTLPSRLLAARFFVPKSVSRIKLVAYDKKGKQLSSKVVDINKNSHNFVYARTLDKTLYTTASDKMWVGVR